MADTLQFTPSGGSATELWRPQAGLRLDLVRGYYEPADVRGDDLVIPMRPGKVEFDRVKNSRSLLLLGYIQGIGVTEAQQWTRFNELATLLQTIFDPSLSSGSLELFAPYYGLQSGSKTISARVANYVMGDARGAPGFQPVQVELVSLTNPPEWS